MTIEKPTHLIIAILIQAEKADIYIPILQLSEIAFNEFREFIGGKEDTNKFEISSDMGTTVIYRRQSNE